MAQVTDRKPDPVDIHVGQRILLRRKGLGISQQVLAAELGLTFQQVQKYEKGTNRVSASKLHKIANFLQTTEAFFFDGLRDEQDGTPAASNDGDTVSSLISSSTGISMAIELDRIKNPTARQKAVAVVRSIADALDETVPETMSGTVEIFPTQHRKQA